MSKELKDYHKDAQEHSQYLDKYFDDLYINQDIERKIHSSILSEDTIADSASPKLNQIRRNKKSRIANQKHLKQNDSFNNIFQIHDGSTCNN